MTSTRDPWHAMAVNWPWVEIYIRRLPHAWGHTVWTVNGEPYIELAHGMGWVQQRCVLAHEMHHVKAGPSSSMDCADPERQVREDTARWLLPDLAEVGKLLAGTSVMKAAWELEVTTEVLADRLASLTEAEETELAALLPEGSTL